MSRSRKGILNSAGRFRDSAPSLGSLFRIHRGVGIESLRAMRTNSPAAITRLGISTSMLMEPICRNTDSTLARRKNPPTTTETLSNPERATARTPTTASPIDHAQSTDGMKPRLLSNQPPPKPTRRMPRMSELRSCDTIISVELRSGPSLLAASSPRLNGLENQSKSAKNAAAEDTTERPEHRSKPNRLNILPRYDARKK